MNLKRRRPPLDADSRCRELLNSLGEAASVPLAPVLLTGAKQRSRRRLEDREGASRHRGRARQVDGWLSGGWGQHVVAVVRNIDAERALASFEVGGRCDLRLSERRSNGECADGEERDQDERRSPARCGGRLHVRTDMGKVYRRRAEAAGFLAQGPEP